VAFRNWPFTRSSIFSGACLIVGLLAADAVVPLSAARAEFDTDFKIAESYLRLLADKNSILVEIPVRLTHRTKNVHRLASDCELHLGGKPIDMSLGDPRSIVVEPPNLCKFEHDSGMKWPEVFDEFVMNRDCVVTGFPRIFTEHASNGDEGANPNHVFEIHPATRLKCDDKVISFESYLTYFPGMRIIKPASADNCLRTRTVSMRHRQGSYEFSEDGGHNCGNFAIVEVGFVEPDWVQKTGGGHSAIARVSLNGSSRSTLKIYTLEGSKADEWLAGVKANGLGDDRIYLHGMFTYDYFAFVRTARTPEHVWINPTEWTKVRFPMAFVVFGMPDSAPWEETH
jgi:hypothetical protein